MMVIEQERVEAWLKEGNNPTTLIEMGQCALCPNEITSYDSVPTCLGVRICRSCEEVLERQRKRKEKKIPASRNEKQFHKQYKLFLQGKKYPEVCCKHTAGDGSVAITRLKDNTGWFDVEGKDV